MEYSHAVVSYHQQLAVLPGKIQSRQASRFLLPLYPYRRRRRNNASATAATTTAIDTAIVSHLRGRNPPPGRPTCSCGRPEAVDPLGDVSCAGSGCVPPRCELVDLVSAMVAAAMMAAAAAAAGVWTNTTLWVAQLFVMP